MEPVAINTVFGIFNFYRDSIILRKVSYENSGLTFVAECPSKDVSVPQTASKYFDFSISFYQIIHWCCTERDTYEALKVHGKSNFEEVKNSDYIGRLPIRPDCKSVKHYRLWTYDDVFDILATDFIISI